MHHLQSSGTRTRAALALAALSLGLALMPGAMAPAGAAAPACVADGDYGQVGGKEDASLSTGPLGRGNRALMYAGGTASCQRISSIYVQSPNRNGFVEFGWVLGWSNCSQTTSAAPRLFYWVRNQFTSIEHCNVLSGSPAPGQSAVYRISDTNGTGTWNAVYNNTAVQTGIGVDFSSGWPLVGMERGASGDSGYALWDELFEYHDSNGWTNWDHPSVFVDTDLSYNYKQYSLYKLASELP